MVPEENGLISSVFIKEIKETVKKYNNKLNKHLLRN